MDELSASKMDAARRRLDIPELKTELKEKYPEYWPWEKEGSERLTYHLFKFQLIDSSISKQKVSLNVKGIM